MERETSENGRAVGRYVLHDEIASGGMATVHVAKLAGAAGFSRAVAVKRLHAQFAKDPEFVAMFVDEARLASRIRHPNVVPVLDVVSTDGELFLVMEYVHGEPLSKLARTARSHAEAVPPRIAVAIMVDVLEALEAAHETRDADGSTLHLVHRDVSPQNVLVGDDGAARLLDFGIAKAVGRQQTTREGEVKGKSAYMSPEQVRGHEVDRRSDVFAAAIVLWELLAGRRLFSSDSQIGTMTQVLESPIDPPSVHASGLPAELDAIVMRGLARPLEERWPSARTMSNALAAALPPASAGEVAAWCARLAGDSLAKRGALIARVERVPDSDPRPAVASSPYAAGGDDATEPDAPAPRPMPEPVPTASGLVRRTVPLAQPLPIAAAPSVERAHPVAARRWALPASIGLALAAMLAGLGVWRVTSVPKPAPVASAAPAPVERESAATAAPSMPSAAVEPAPSESTASATPSARRPPPKPRPASATKQNACNPPWTVDAQGVRIAKRECL